MHFPQSTFLETWTLRCLAAEDVGVLEDDLEESFEEVRGSQLDGILESMGVFQKVIPWQKINICESDQLLFVGFNIQSLVR